MIWWQLVHAGAGSMLTAIIATHESERTLVPTLAALVPGVTCGLLREVIVADAGSRDATAEVAEIAGCRFIGSSEPLGARLRAAAATTRTPWLLFLRAGCAPEPAWIHAAERFMQAADLAERAAVFRQTGEGQATALPQLLALLRAAIAGPRPEQGLLIARRFYDVLGGHTGEDAETALLRKLGRRRIALLACGATAPR